ncbi:MAG: recombinase family protein [Planctomycetota bacterium]|jgi:DNA invertase Pin-like site-specific DNA recombinase
MDVIAHSKTRTVGYVRRSTDRQEQSIEDQKKALKLYAAENGLQFLKFYIDDAISGTSAIGRRAFQQMIEDAQSQTRLFDIIVVYDVKRFGRVDNDEAGYYRHILRTHGVEVNYVSENFTGDTTDDLLRPVKQWQARQESKDLSKVTIPTAMTSNMNLLMAVSCLSYDTWLMERNNCWMKKGV